jgi:hypothetical protein
LPKNAFEPYDELPELAPELDRERRLGAVDVFEVRRRLGEFDPLLEDSSPN